MEIDDAYLSGERSGGKTGRDSENKVPFVMAVQAAGEGLPHQVCAAQLSVRRQAVAEFCQRHLVRPLTVISDGLNAFHMAADAGVRQRIVPGGSKAIATRPEYSAVDIMLGNLKTTIVGTYHAFRFRKYASRYLAEFQFRFNRRYCMPQLLPQVLAALVSAPLSNTDYRHSCSSACPSSAAQRTGKLGRRAPMVKPGIPRRNTGATVTIGPNTIEARAKEMYTKTRWNRHDADLYEVAPGADWWHLAAAERSTETERLKYSRYWRPPHGICAALAAQVWLRWVSGPKSDVRGSASGASTKFRAVAAWWPSACTRAAHPAANLHGEPSQLQSERWPVAKGLADADHGQVAV